MKTIPASTIQIMFLGKNEVPLFLPAGPWVAQNAIKKQLNTAL